jgi:hypothetical protein
MTSLLGTCPASASLGKEVRENHIVQQVIQVDSVLSADGVCPGAHERLYGEVLHLDRAELGAGVEELLTQGVHVAHVEVA